MSELTTYVFKLMDGTEFKKPINCKFLSEVCENIQTKDGIFSDNTWYFKHAIKSVRQL